MHNLLLAVTVMTAATVFTRSAPFLFFMRRRPPEILTFIQRFIPPMIMTILVLNSFKGIRFDRFPSGLPEIAAASGVALLHLWRRNTLLSIIGGTALYMVLIRVI